jgi:hypothetical protein
MNTGLRMRKKSLQVGSQMRFRHLFSYMYQSIFYPELLEFSSLSASSLRRWIPTSRNDTTDRMALSISPRCCTAFLKLLIVLERSSAPATLYSPGWVEYLYIKVRPLPSQEQTAILLLTPHRRQTVCSISHLLLYSTILWNWNFDQPMSWTLYATPGFHQVLNMSTGFWCPRNYKTRWWQAQGHLESYCLIPECQ